MLKYKSYCQTTVYWASDKAIQMEKPETQKWEMLNQPNKHWLSLDVQHSKHFIIVGQDVQYIPQ